METPLLTRWLGDSDPIFVSGRACVDEVRERVLSLAAELGLPRDAGGRAADAAEALTEDQLRHVRSGYVSVREVRRGQIPGVEIVAADRGHGPADARAFAEGGALAQVRGLVHEVDVELREREGTCVRARAFATEPPRVWEVGLAAIPHPDEQVNGDDGVCLWDEDGLLIALLDGLGHGPEAADAAGVGVDAVRTSGERRANRLLPVLEQALASTIGAAGAVVRLDPETAELTHVCRGNIAVQLAGGKAVHLPCSPGVLGRRGPRSTRPARARLVDGLLVLHTDGIPSRFDLQQLPVEHDEHPVLLAARIVEAWAREGDDAMVVVVRERKRATGGARR